MNETTTTGSPSPGELYQRDDVLRLVTSVTPDRVCWRYVGDGAAGMAQTNRSAPHAAWNKWAARATRILAEQ